MEQMLLTGQLVGLQDYKLKICLIELKVTKALLNTTENPAEKQGFLFQIGLD